MVHYKDGALAEKGCFNKEYNSKIVVYGSMPYVGLTPKKNGGHIESAQMTRLKYLC